MTPELEFIRDEIADLEAKDADVQMLEALANNTVYVLSKLQKEKGDQMEKKYRHAIDTVIVEVLNTINKEIQWAHEEDEDVDERKNWFSKAQRQILKDISLLFE